MDLNEIRKETDKVTTAFLAKRSANGKRSHTDGQALYLHGHKIVWHGDGGKIHANHAGWPTTTTKDRINGVAHKVGAAGVHTKKGVLHHGDRPIHSDETFNLREELMKEMMELTEGDHNHSDTELSHEAKELILHGDNDSHLYHSSRKPIVKNLEKKMKKGVYDHEKAKKLWGYHADRAAQSYTKQYGHPGQKWHEMFAPKHRKAAASHWADEHREETNLGNFHESDNFAAEIVFAAMGRKSTDANLNFKEALLERSKQLIDDTKAEMAGQFMESFKHNQN